MSNYVRDAFDKLCGGCHVHGEDPRLDPRLAEDSCAVCDRTPAQIQAAHWASIDARLDEH